MAEQQNRGKKTQKPRTSKTSKGVHGGGGKVTLNEVQKVLMNRGLYRTTKVIGR